MTTPQNIQANITPQAQPTQPVVQTYTFEQYQAGISPPPANTVPPPVQNLDVKPPVSNTVATPPLENGGSLPSAIVDEVLTPWKVLFWSIEEPVLPEYIEDKPVAMATQPPAAV